MSDTTGSVINNGWRVLNRTNITATENGRYKIKTECFIQAVNTWSFAGLNVRGSAGVAGQWANIDKTGVNISTNGAVSLISKEIWVNRTHSTQTISCGAEVIVTGYAAGKSGNTQTINVPAKPSHTVSYNANGGNGAPGNATKWYGEDFYISTTKPTRANHTFLGWATSANGNVAYQPGARYLPDANVTLYAKWRLNANPPTIKNFTAYRCNEDGTANESGTYVKMSATWSVDTAGDSSNKCNSLTFAYQSPSGSWVNYPISATTGTSATTTLIKDGYDTDQAWNLRVTLTDKYATRSATTIIGPEYYAIDISPTEKSIGIGIEAPDQGVSIYGNPVRINNCPIPNIYKGSIVITPTGSSTRHDLFNATKYAEITGHAISGHVVLVSNGDLDANNNAVIGASWSNKDQKYYVHLSAVTSSPFRVNYIIFT